MIKVFLTGAENGLDDAELTVANIQLRLFELPAVSSATITLPLVGDVADVLADRVLGGINVTVDDVLVVQGASWFAQYHGGAASGSVVLFVSFDAINSVPSSVVFDQVSYQLYSSTTGFTFRAPFRWLLPGDSAVVDDVARVVSSVTASVYAESASLSVNCQ